MAERPHLILRVRARASWQDRAARVVVFVAGLAAFAILGFIVWVLLSNSLDFFRLVSIKEFLLASRWHAVEGPSEQYGIRPLLAGTLLVTVGAAVIGLPLGLATAVYLSEYATPRLRAAVKPTLELLAGIPSIVYGFFALQIISPWVVAHTKPGTVGFAIFGESAQIFNAASAMIVVGVMVLPIVTSLSEDALRAVPRHLREASLGLGATKWETVRKVVVPGAVSGITASFVLGVSRAIGESMAVALVAGTQANLTLNPVDSIMTMTSFIVLRTSGDVPHSGAVYLSLFAVGLTLFVLTFAMNIVARAIIVRHQEVE